MSFKAELKFNDSNNIYRILECDYEFTQSIDATGKPCAKTKGGMIHVVVESMYDPAMMQWAVATSNVRSGKIVFYKDDSEKSTLKTLVFKNAYCVHLQDRFHSEGQYPMSTSFTINAQEITLDDTTFIQGFTA
jgi:hypothetical protein